MFLKVLKPSATYTTTTTATFLMAYQLSKVAALEALADNSVNTITGNDCHNNVCHPIEQYCSQFEQDCLPCAAACNPKDLKYEPSICSRQCSDFLKLEPLKNEIHHIKMQQNIMLILLILLLVIVVLHYTWKIIKLLRQKCCFKQVLKKLKLKMETSKPKKSLQIGKDLGGTTIQNMCVINDIERAPSQINSTVAEGSVMTMTTPISTRYPAENATPSPQPHEYSYDNKALVVTPVSEKPSGAPVF